MKGYEEVGSVSQETVDNLMDALQHAKWQESKGGVTLYRAWTNAEKYVKYIKELGDIWDVDKWKMAWFVVIPSGGHLHRHTDGDKTFQTYHIPIQTNPRALCYMYEPDKTAYHLEVGKIYKVNRQLDHESSNDGPTDRIHFLLDVEK